MVDQGSMSSARRILNSGKTSGDGDPLAAGSLHPLTTGCMSMENLRLTDVAEPKTPSAHAPNLSTSQRLWNSSVSYTVGVAWKNPPGAAGWWCAHTGYQQWFVVYQIFHLRDSPERKRRGAVLLATRSICRRNQRGGRTHPRVHLSRCRRAGAEQCGATSQRCIQ
jgi:hypothetical protein